MAARILTADDQEGVEFPVRRPDGSLPTVEQLTEEILSYLYLSVLEPGEQADPVEMGKNRASLMPVAAAMIREEEEKMS